MPLYRTLVRPGLLTEPQRASFAKDVVDVHCDVTGAPRSFVHVLYAEDDDGRLDEGQQATASVSFRSVPTGYMFTEGRQSTSSIIACVLEHDTTLEDRERYMRGVCDVWTEVTGCTDHEVVVAITAVDPD